MARRPHSRISRYAERPVAEPRAPHVEPPVADPPVADPRAPHVADLRVLAATISDLSVLIAQGAKIGGYGA